MKKIISSYANKFNIQKFCQVSSYIWHFVCVPGHTWHFLWHA